MSLAFPILTDGNPYPSRAGSDQAIRSMLGGLSLTEIASVVNVYPQRWGWILSERGVPPQFLEDLATRLQARGLSGPWLDVFSSVIDSASAYLTTREARRTAEAQAALEEAAALRAQHAEVLRQQQLALTQAAGAKGFLATWWPVFAAGGLVVALGVTRRRRRR